MQCPSTEALIPVALGLLLAGACSAPAGGVGSTPTLAPETRADNADGPGAGGRDLAAGSAGGRAASGAEHSGGGLAPNAVVERVVDGDTLIVRFGERSETVRLIGIDTPESVAPTRPVQCYGREASLYLEWLLPAGTEVTLVRDAEARDLYDRLLGYVVRSRDSLFANLELVATGHAAVLNLPPNTHYAETLAQAQTEAKAAGLGLWGACGGPDVPLH